MAGEPSYTDIPIPEIFDSGPTSAKGKGRIKEEELDPEIEREQLVMQELGQKVAKAVTENMARLPKDEDKSSRPKRPEPFDGKPESLKVFLIQLDRYFNAHPWYNTETRKCEEALSLCSGAVIQDWAYEILDRRTPTYLLNNYSLLKHEIKKLWGPKDETRRSQEQLPMIKQEFSIGDYHARFITVANKTGYNDDALAYYFYKGLKTAIKDMMVTVDRPTTVTTMLDLAIKFEGRILARNEERKKEGTPFKKQTFIKAGRLSPEERTKLMKEGACFICKKKGHMSRACPQRTTVMPKTSDLNYIGTKDEGTPMEEDFVKG